MASDSNKALVHEFPKCQVKKKMINRSLIIVMNKFLTKKRHAPQRTGRGLVVRLLAGFRARDERDRWMHFPNLPSFIRHYRKIPSMKKVIKIVKMNMQRRNSTSDFLLAAPVCSSPRNKTLPHTAHASEISSKQVPFKFLSTNPWDCGDCNIPHV